MVFYFLKKCVAKRLGPFDVQKVHETQTMQKQENLLYRVKTKIRGIV
jgi:hypothetical protein